MSTGEIVIVLVAAGFASLVKSVTGMGFPIVLIPVLALFIDIADAIVIVAPANLVLNLSIGWNVRSERRDIVGFGSFVGSSIVGAAVGGLLLPVLPGRVLRLILVAVIALFLLNRWRSPAAALQQHRARQLSPLVGGVAGLFQGAAGVSGPIVTPWFLSQNLPRQAFVFAISTTFAVSGMAQLVVLLAADLYVGEVLGLALALIPLSLLLMPLGMRLRGRIGAAAFERAIIALLVVSAVSILVRVF